LSVLRKPTSLNMKKKKAYEGEGGKEKGDLYSFRQGGGQVGCPRADQSATKERRGSGSTRGTKAEGEKFLRRRKGGP